LYQARSEVHTRDASPFFLGLRTWASKRPPARAFMGRALVGIGGMASEQCPFFSVTSGVRFAVEVFPERFLPARFRGNVVSRGRDVLAVHRHPFPLCHEFAAPQGAGCGMYLK
jgi:hypothetical protein